MKQNTASQRIAAEMRQRIRSGKLAAGARIPSAREIVRQHGVALATASKVIAILRREGLVRIQRGVGTIVRSGERAHELTEDQIVRAAIAIADEDGLSAMSMRQVALELGTATVQLHRAFESREDLVLAMADKVLGDVPLPKLGLHWRKTLEGLTRAQWSSYAAHPWLVGTLSMTRPQLMPNGMRHTETVLSALASLRLGPAQTIRTAVMLLAYVRGMAVGLEAEKQAEQDTGMSSDEWMQSREALFHPFVSKFPLLGKLTRQGDVDMSLDALFERGLGLLLDGLEKVAP